MGSSSAGADPRRRPADEQGPPPPPMAGGAVVACLKWVDHRPDIDPLTGVVTTDPRTSGPSGADEAALELALRTGRRWGVPVVAVTAGGTAAEAVLRAAVACGVTVALRVDTDASLPSAEVARAVAGALTDTLAGAGKRAAAVLCGAWSLDRGTGAFPAFLAAELGWAQALGLVSLDIGAAGRLAAERRLDGGRRERLRVTAPAVLSVEASTARLRRAGLDGVLAAAHAPVGRWRPQPASAGWPAGNVTTGPLRPRPRQLAPPVSADARGRVLQLTGANREQRGARVLTLAPAEAAAVLLEQLRAWGYLD